MPTCLRLVVGPRVEGVGTLLITLVRVHIWCGSVCVLSLCSVQSALKAQAPKIKRNSLNLAA